MGYFSNISLQKGTLFIACPKHGLKTNNLKDNPVYAIKNLTDKLIVFETLSFVLNRLKPVF